MEKAQIRALLAPERLIRRVPLPSSGWERCPRCRQEYRAGVGALCDAHGLCGLCHEPDGVTPKDGTR